MLLLALIFGSSFLNLVLSLSKHPLVLVVSFDAFRHDFLNKTATPNLYALSQLGVRAKYIRNIFPTKTFPNHFTIGTGVWAEDHGVLGNTVFYNNHSHGYSEELFHYNEDIVPIWTLNQKGGKGRHSGSMMWPGAEFPYQGVSPTFAVGYNISYDWNKRVDVAISWFLNTTTPANLVMLYFEEPDYMGHRHGINDPLFKAQIQRCDQTAKYIQDRLTASPLKDKVNVFLTSDHGMVSVKQDHIIDLNNYANLKQFNVSGTSPVLQITVYTSLNTTAKQALVNRTYSDLKHGEQFNGHFNIYLANEIPDSYHYKHNTRVSDMLAVAKVPYAFQDLLKTIDWYRKGENQTVTPDSEFGIHGYTNDDPTMYPFFTAFGPDLKKNTSVAPFDNVDFYPLFAELLKLPLPARTARFQLRGSLDHVSNLIATSSPSFGLSTLTIALLSVGTFTLMLFFSVLVLSFWNSVLCRPFRTGQRMEAYAESGLAEEREALIKPGPSSSETSNVDLSSNTYEVHPADVTIETPPRQDFDPGAGHDLSRSLLPR